ncbi:NHR domain-containing protein, partial [Caerostris extrusa]
TRDDERRNAGANDKRSTGLAPLTFYVNCRGHLHLFVNNDHKGAVLTGLPLKEQLWVLFGFIRNYCFCEICFYFRKCSIRGYCKGPRGCSSLPVCIKQWKCSLLPHKASINWTSDGKKTILKKLLVRSCETFETECDGIDTTCVCQTTENSGGQPWTLIKTKNKSTTEDANNNDQEESVEEETPEKNSDELSLVVSADEEYFKAIAINIVKEMIIQRKEQGQRRQEKKTPGFRLQSSLSRIGGSRGTLKQEEATNSKIRENSISNENEELPDDLPRRVVELVETMLKDFFLSPQTIYLFVFDLAQDLDCTIQNNEDYGLEFPSSNLSILSLLNLWLETIYVSLAHQKKNIRMWNRRIL